MHIHNPYLEGDGVWLRANLHAHTTESDGRRTPQDLVDTYHRLGYDGLMISDHDMVTPIADLDDHGMLLLTGNEVTARGPHLCHIGAAVAVEAVEDRQVVIDAVNAAGGMVVVNHPNWTMDFNHCPFESLLAWRDYHGIEIYNGVGERHPGNPVATNKWDRMLSTGRWVWAFANDDTHRPEVDEGRAWNVFRARQRNTGALLEAIRAGSSYCSTGVTVESLAVEGDKISIETLDAQRITVVSDHGRRLMTVDTKHMHFTVPKDFEGTYLRFECWGRGDSRAWSQPFFIVGG